MNPHALYEVMVCSLSSISVVNDRLATFLSFRIPINPSDENKNILGFVLGREKAKGYLKRILKSSLFTFVIEGIKLLFIKPKSLIRLVRNLDKISKDSSISDTQNYAEIGAL